MVRRSAAALFAAMILIGGCGSLHTDALVDVTNANPAGPGSFAAAIEAANRNPRISQIKVSSNLGTIELRRALHFKGRQKLQIDGGGVVLSARAVGSGSSAFLASGGANLTISNLTVRRAPDVGISILVPGTASGTLRFEFNNVHVDSCGGHGILINDQAEYLSNPDTEAQTGSVASLDVRISNGKFENNGWSYLDRDGLRINEGGAGDANVLIEKTVARRNGGEGIEIDERSIGSVRVHADQVLLEHNGHYSQEDPDDGLDIDETGGGSVTGKLAAVSARANAEQGFDLNEADAGDLNIDLIRVEAIGNGAQGVDLKEEGKGAQMCRLIAVIDTGNSKPSRNIEQCTVAPQ